ncbi:acetoacetate decarboxylase family protein [Caldimonas tepidiphila]|uniref:acetoacetate decarboxylase family protein n=1 Tax=Caldimonas tepidiphila TaxID=2315841 RepID=UPI00130022D9|nr:acetoacetate decarboxylase family protein [Caldimonas tepidiphila]
MDDPITSRHPGSEGERLGGLFEGLLQWELPQLDARLPLFIPDLGMMTAVFSAATARVAPLLPHRDMRPIEMLPGRCLIAFAALEYRASDLGPYDEFVIAVPIGFGANLPAIASALKDALGGTASAYIWQMPVTTRRACEAGIGIAGFPKFVADIAFERQGAQLACTVSHEGRHLATLRCDTEPAGSQRTLHARSYTVKDGVPLLTALRVRQQRAVEHLHGWAASLELGSHPIADVLRTLELSERPLATQYCPQAQAVMFFPRHVGEP